MAGEDARFVNAGEIKWETAPPKVTTAPNVPVIYVDAVSNHVMAPGIAKMFFHRVDGSPTDPNSYAKVPVLQLVMPAQSFADMVAFLEFRLRLMVENNYLTQEVVDERRKFYDGYAKPQHG